MCFWVGSAVSDNRAQPSTPEGCCGLMSRTAKGPPDKRAAIFAPGRRSARGKKCRFPGDGGGFFPEGLPLLRLGLTVFANWLNGLHTGHFAGAGQLLITVEPIWPSKTAVPIMACCRKAERPSAPGSCRQTSGSAGQTWGSLWHSGPAHVCGNRRGRSRSAGASG